MTTPDRFPYPRRRRTTGPGPGLALALALALAPALPGCGESRAVDSDREAEPTPPAAIAAALEGLASRDRAVRTRAADALRAAGPDALPWVRATAVARGGEPAARALAVRILGESGDPDPEALCALLRDRSGKVVAAALEALEGLGEVGIPCLVGELSHGDAQHRTRAALRIARTGTASLPALLRAGSETTDEETLRAVCEALRRIEGVDAHADRVIPTLTRAFTSEEPRLQRSALGALAACGSAGRAALVRLVAEAPSPPEPGPATAAVRRAAVALAGENEPGLVRLLELARSDRAATRTVAMSGLGHADLFDARVRDALVTALDDPESEVRLAAAAELRRHAGVALKPILPALFGALENPDDAVAEAVLETLCEIGPSVGGRVVKHLDPGRDEKTLLRMISIAARVSTSSSEVLPRLEALTDSGSNRVREAAEAAIRRIRERRER